MHDRILDETSKIAKQLLDEGISDSNNLEYLDKLVDIQKDVYKIKCMKEGNEMYGNYGNYGENYGRGSYGRENYGRGGYGENSYGRRGVDSRYRGQEHLDRMNEEYGRYSYGRERYGAGQETDKSFHYMVEALEDFIKVLYEEADSQAQKQELMQVLQKSMM